MWYKQMVRLQVEYIELKNWLAVWHSRGVGAAKFAKFLEKNGKMSEIPESIKEPNWLAAEAALNWKKSSNCHILTLKDAKYPQMLRNINDAPPVIYVKGDIDVLSKPQIAMVGTRNPTANGRELARAFASHFAKLGFVVTSGLALGVDGQAHQGVLDVVGGQTIAVLGHGLDFIYPAKHERLANQIVAQGGALVSEFPLKTAAKASNFPRRNRIISGLSLGTLVVEAAMKSGSLITARTAVEQGREVFAIPGSIHNPAVRGCHHLIKQGAKLVETADDVLEEMGVLLKYVTRDTTPKITEEHSAVGLASELKKLLDSVDYEMTPIDTVINRTGIVAQEVSGMLLELELEGYITSVLGG